jgi:hypothetical protein
MRITAVVNLPIILLALAAGAAARPQTGVTLHPNKPPLVKGSVTLSIFVPPVFFFAQLVDRPE